MFEYLEKLNKEQLAAATTIAGPVLILAGAGTGKTHTLISRVAYMLDQGINPEEILLLTFTNKAAEEMKERIISFIGKDKGKRITACTFHSFCTICLRKYAYLLEDYNNDFTIIDEEDAKEVLSGFVEKWKAKYEREHKKRAGFFKVSFIMGIYSASTNEVQPIKNMIDSYYRTYEIDDYVRGCIEEYNIYKLTRNLMDYDDLLKHMYLLLCKHPDVRMELDKHFKYIMCDEYQDTNIIQDKLLDMLSESYQNLAVVGDDNQSIYRFRGAKIENILSFPQRKPRCTVIHLFENYRSTQEILDFANEVMRYAKEGYPKMLHGQSNGEVPSLEVVDDQTEEALRIVDMVQRYHEEGIPYEKMSVLIRMSNQSSFIEKELANRKIIFAKFGGIKFLSKAAVRDILAFLRASNMNKDEIAWSRILRLYPQIGTVYGNQIAEEIAMHGYTVLIDPKYDSKSYKPALNEVYNVVSILKNMSFDQKMDYLVNTYYVSTMKQIVQDSKMTDYAKNEKIKEIENSQEDLQILMEMARSFDTTTDFLDSITLSFSNPVNTEDNDLFNISTVHSAKGLEYDVVFLVGAIQGSFPRNMKNDDDNKESLRCMYVALTRAKYHLHIFIPKEHNGYRSMESSYLSSHLAQHSILNKCVYDKEILEMFPRI